MIANGPTSTPSASSAPGSTTAVGWTRIFPELTQRWLWLSVHDRRQELALRADGRVHAGLALELPHVGAMVDDLDEEIEPVARSHGVPEFRFIDTEEKHQVRRWVE